MHLDADVIDKRKRKSISVCTLFSSPKIVFCLITMFLGTFNIVFWGSWLSDDLSNYPAFNEDYLGYVIGSQSFTYLFGCLLLPYTCEAAPRRLLFVIACAGFGISCFFLGPSKLLDLPQNMWFILAAFPLMGIF